MFQLTFTEDEINLIWNTLANSNITGKSAPILTVIFNKIQASVNRVALQQQRMKQEQELLSAQQQEVNKSEDSTPVEEETDSF